MRMSEIFALLGHDCVSKTTVFNCLVGLIPPTAGKATMNGFDICTDLDSVRRQSWLTWMYFEEHATAGDNLCCCDNLEAFATAADGTG